MADQEVIDLGWKKYSVELTKDVEYVDVGIVASDGAQKIDNDLTLAELASVQEFGMTIDHPGGTSFGFKTKAAMERGEIRFLKKGKGVFEMGITGPHEIVIPSRPFIRGTFDEHEADLAKLVEEMEDEILAGKKTRKQALTQIGQTHQNQIQKAMNTAGKFEPNAPSTIRKKGSAQPLKDKGRLVQAINFEVG